MVRLGAQRFFMGRRASSPSLPYDARVLYVETDGVGSYINTGIVPDGSSVISISFAVQSLSYEGSGTTYNCVCGASVPNTNLLVGRFGLNVSYNNDQFRFSTPSLTNYATDSPAYDHLIHDAVIAYPENGGVRFDGTQLSTYSPSSSLVYDDLCLGAGRDVARDTNTNRNRLFSGTRFYSCKIYTNGVLVFDGIPVRKNGQGYIYDRVSGRLCGNAGAAGTSVTYGADVPFDNEVAYVERDWSVPWLINGSSGLGGIDLSRYLIDESQADSTRSVEMEWSFYPESNGTRYSLWYAVNTFGTGISFLKRNNGTVYSFTLSGNNSTVTGSLDTFHTQKAVPNGNGTWNLLIDNVEVGTYTSTLTTKFNNLTLLRGLYGSGSQFKMRIKSFKLGNDVNLIPVVKGNAIGFFNRIDGLMFTEEQSCLTAGPIV